MHLLVAPESLSLTCQRGSDGRPLISVGGSDRRLRGAPNRVEDPTQDPILAGCVWCGRVVSVAGHCHRTDPFGGCASGQVERWRVPPPHSHFQSGVRSSAHTRADRSISSLVGCTGALGSEPSAFSVPTTVCLGAVPRSDSLRPSALSLSPFARILLGCSVIDRSVEPTAK